MTIFAATCRLAKAIAGCEERRPIHETLVKIDRAPRESTDSPDIKSGDDHGKMLGYLSRKNPYQFRAILALNKLAEEKSLGLPQRFQNDIVPLSKDAWLHLSVGDIFIDTVTKKLLSRLGHDGKPLACDPAFLVKQGPRHPSATADVLMHNMEAEIGTLVEQFANHPCVSRVDWEGGPEIQALAIGVNGFREQVLRQCRNPRREDVEMLRGLSPKMDTEESATMANIGRIFAIHQSVHAIKTILFDAFRMSRLATLSEDNVIDMRRTDDLLGSVAQCSVQPNGDEFLHLGPADLVIVVPDDMETRVEKGPGIVFAQEISVNQVTGYTMSLRIRMLDEWLNPYPGAVS